MLFFSKLVQPYFPNQVIAEYTVAGSYTIEIKGDGIYEIEAVSGGGSGQHGYWFDNWYTNGNGATGCYYKNTFFIIAGTYAVTVGAGGIYPGGHSSGYGGSTSFGNILNLVGGAGWYWNLQVHNEYLVNNTPGYLDYAHNTKGTAVYAQGYGGSGSVGNPGQNPHSENIGPQNNYGLGAYGKGGWSNSGDCGPGTNGYLKITYKGLY